uniref:Uncharacterized protein n=1 Tax=Haptolina brevifila TaxID=156173 RepID=A0A7S2FFQ6_9EUKA
MLPPTGPVYIKNYAAAGETDFGEDGGGVDDTGAYRTHAQADYSDGSEWIEVWFKNECKNIHGMTTWGRYTYGRWWKGVCARYVRHSSAGCEVAVSASNVEDDPSTKDASPSSPSTSASEAIQMEQLYSYAELEHEAVGPTLTVGMWRLPPLPDHLKSGDQKVSVHFCLAKAKAFGIKRIVHRISIPYADLVNRRTTITWVQD